MGRKAVISRENLIDIAEEILRKDGAAALTIGALAKAAGISKGGVQYSFASKDELVRALVERWADAFDRAIGAAAEDDPLCFVRRYITASRQSDSLIDAKMAGLMMGYMRDPENLRVTREWYHGIFKRLSGDSAQARAARVAFLAVEGLFLMRINGLDTNTSWDSFLTDIEAVLHLTEK